MKEMIFVLEDNKIMAECIAQAASAAGAGDVRCFPDAVAAVGALDADELPELIFLDVLLTGPDGFTFLNELASYDDTNKIPVVVVSSLDFTGRDLSAYNVVGALKKETMTPDDIKRYAREYTKNAG